MPSDHFSTQSADYARYRPTYPAAWFDWLAGTVSSRQLAWDCACGSGQATGALAERFNRVIATDLSSAQLAQAPALPNVEWRAAHAEESGLASGSADLVTVAQALHWFDQPRFWEEAQRVLKPDGVLAVWSYGLFTTDHEEIAALCHHFYSETVGSYWPPERAIVVRGYASLTFPFAEISPPPVAMSADWTLEQLLGYLASWSATARYEKDRGSSPIPELRRQLERIWGNAARTFHWPLSIRVGRKTAG